VDEQTRRREEGKDDHRVINSNPWMESLASPHEPHVLGATITILHELVHVVCRIFCTTWTPEKFRGSHMPASVPMLNPGGWEWEQNVLGEMQVVFGGRRLD
jgi:hypothetical protein